MRVGSDRRARWREGREGLRDTGRVNGRERRAVRREEGAEGR